MGNSQSAINVLNKNILQTVIKKSEISSTFCNSLQTISLSGAEIENCNVLISQNAQSVCELDKIVGFRNKSELLSTIKESIDKSENEVDKGTKEMLATAISINNQQMSLKSYLTTIMELNITDETASFCLASASSEQMQKIRNLKITCTGDNELDSRFSQNIQLYQFASCVTNAVTDIIKNDQIINDIVMKSEKVTDVTKVGLFNKNMLKMLGIVLGILFVIFLIGLYFYIKLKTSKVPV